MRAPAAQRASVNMAVEDMVGGINEGIFGGTPEGKIFDPLGLGADEASLYRRRVVEIKHGRVCMLAFLGMTIGPDEVRSACTEVLTRSLLLMRICVVILCVYGSQLITPTHTLLSPSADLYFDDVPGGIAAIDVVPAAGWLQILAVVGIHELTIAKQDYTKVPGEVPTFLGFKPEDPAVFRNKQLKERTPAQYLVLLP